MAYSNSGCRDYKSAPYRPGPPIGTIQIFGGALTSLPENWLDCDGSAVSRTTYNALFAVIGTTWGEGNGTTTFNLPNMKSRAPFGWDAGTTGLVGAAGYLNTGGSATIAEANLPAHRHFIASVAAPSTTVALGTGNSAAYTSTDGTNTQYLLSSDGTGAGTDATIGRSSATGSGTAYYPRYQPVVYAIRAY